MLTFSCCLIKIHMVKDVVRVEAGVEEGAGAAEVDMVVVDMAADMGTTKDTINMETIRDTTRGMGTIRVIKVIFGCIIYMT